MVFDSIDTSHHQYWLKKNTGMMVKYWNCKMTLEFTMFNHILQYIYFLSLKSKKEITRHQDFIVDRLRVSPCNALVIWISLFFNLSDWEWSFLKSSLNLFWGNSVSITPSRITYIRRRFRLLYWNMSNTRPTPIRTVSLPMKWRNSSGK